MTILQNLSQSKSLHKKGLIILIDPDKFCFSEIDTFVLKCEQLNVFMILVGGSLISSTRLNELVVLVKSKTSIPVVLFPASVMHLNEHVDATLFLSLISGRNPDFLIGHHVVAAPILKQYKQEIIPTGYMLVDSGSQTTASYMSNTMPLPAHKPDVALATALAGELLGLKCIFMDGGSGAKNPVNENMIKTVADGISIPLIVGGGITTTEAAYAALSAGADFIVVGNALEENMDFAFELYELISSFNTTTSTTF